MATAFDSFNRSPLDGFVQSPLQARGDIPTGIMRYATAALSFGITPTAPYQKWPQYSPFVPGTSWNRVWQNVGGSLVYLGEGTGAGGGDMPLDAGCFASVYYRVTRQRTQPVMVPANAPPSAWHRVRVLAGTPADARPALVYMAHQSVPCSFDGPSGGWLLGVAQPGVDNYLNTGPLVPGQLYYLFVQIQNDMSYVNVGNSVLYRFFVSNDGASLRLETFV